MIYIYWKIIELKAPPRACSSMQALSNETEIKYTTLKYHFSTNKRMYAETRGYKVFKIKLVASKRKKI